MSESGLERSGKRLRVALHSTKWILRGGAGGETVKFDFSRWAAFSDFFRILGSFFGLFFGSFFVLFFVGFLIVLGRHLGSFLGAKIDPRRAKLGSRRLLKRYFLKKVNFHADLRFPRFFH